MDDDTNNQAQPQQPLPPQYQPQNSPTPAGPAQPPAPQPAAQRPPLRIDHNLLIELGLTALPDDEKKALEKHIYETLEMRVGMKLADQMTNEQLDEFETYFNAKDDSGAFRWLETNFPNYKDIVAAEFETLKAEVASQAPSILAASQQQTVAPDQVVTAQPPAPYGQPPQPPQYPQPDAGADPRQQQYPPQAGQEPSSHQPPTYQ